MAAAWVLACRDGVTQIMFEAKLKNSGGRSPALLVGRGTAVVSRVIILEGQKRRTTNMGAARPDGLGQKHCLKLVSFERPYRAGHSFENANDKRDTPIGFCIATAHDKSSRNASCVIDCLS